MLLTKKSQKKGWIRIIEAFVAILIVAGVLLVTVGEGYINKEDISEKVYNDQIKILREIELDSSLRNDILNLEVSIIPVESDEPDFPQGLTDKINIRMPNYLECKAKICELEKVCALNSYVEKDVYAQPVAIAADENNYSPRQLKLFCWVK
jgi:hypothetical protein